AALNSGLQRRSSAIQTKSLQVKPNPRYGEPGGDWGPRYHYDEGREVVALVIGSTPNSRLLYAGPSSLPPSGSEQHGDRSCLLFENSTERLFSIGPDELLLSL